MQNATGGFGGGHGQLSHCAPTYAAILSLVTVGAQEALNFVNRRALSVKKSCPPDQDNAELIVFAQVVLAGRN